MKKKEEKLKKLSKSELEKISGGSWGQRFFKWFYPRAWEYKS